MLEDLLLAWCAADPASSGGNVMVWNERSQDGIVPSNSGSAGGEDTDWEDPPSATCRPSDCRSPLALDFSFNSYSHPTFL